jgi:Cytochrome P450
MVEDTSWSLSRPKLPEFMAPWKNVLGALASDEKGGSLLGELSWARFLPWRASSKQSPDPDAADADPALNAAVVAAGLATALVGCVVVKSAVQMVLWRRKLRDADSDAPAHGPTPIPFLGNMLDLRSGYYATLYKYIDKPAAVFWILSTPFVVINDADCVRTVLSGSGGKYLKPKYFGYRSKAVKNAVEAEQKNVVAESVDYSDEGDASRVALSRLVESSFVSIKKSMNQLMETLADATGRMEIEEKQSDALADVRKSIVSLNLDVLFGMGANSSEAKRVADQVGFAGAEFARRMVNPLRVLVDIPGNLRYLRDVGGLIGLGRMLCAKLDEAVVNSGRGGEGLSWVHAWVGKVGKVGKLGKVVGLLMASSQTVPTTAVWMLHLVSKHDDVREELLRELNGLGIASVADLTYAHMSKLQIADAVIRETLRLYPPFPLIQRQAQEDVLLGGITVPSGTHVYIVPWLVHRNPKLWSSPHEFKPRRFLQGNASRGDAPSDWAYLPFGRGPRMCAGSQLAFVELKVLLAHALLQFEWHSNLPSDAPGDDNPFPELGMVPKGIQLYVKRAKHDANAEESYHGTRDALFQ